MENNTSVQNIGVLYKKNGVWQKGEGLVYVRDGIYSDDADKTGKSKTLHSIRSLDDGKRIDIEPTDMLMFQIEDAIEVTIEDWIQKFFSTIVIRFKNVYEFSIIEPPLNEELTGQLWIYGDPKVIMLDQFPVHTLRVPSSIKRLWCHEHTNIIGLEHHLFKKNTEIEMSSS